MRMKGSITVEAVILLPFVIILSMLLMYFTIYVYDRTLLVQDVNVLVSMSGNASLYGKSSKRICESEYTEICNLHPYLSFAEIELIYKDNGLSKDVGLKGEWELPIAPSFNRKIEYKKKVRTSSPVMIMYTTEKLLDLKKEDD